MGGDPFSDTICVSHARRANRVKLLFWDGTGVCLFAKRLEDGKFRSPRSSTVPCVSRRRTSRPFTTTP